jgi:peptidyl-prolyl cis-trans isomerase C
MKASFPMLFKNVLIGTMLLVTAMGLSACGSKDKKAGQALVRVNGEEITVLQINDELKRAGVKADQQETATKQLLESLIDRQLILAEAMRNKIDRTPEVTQAIERAKAQIIAQAYLKSIMSKITKPSIAEINDYFQKHPEYFTQRKQYDIQQLIIVSKDLSNELKSAIDSASSLDSVEAWLHNHNIRYVRAKLTRNTSDLPEVMVAKLKDMKKGQLFIVTEGEKSLLNIITDIKDSPVSAKDAEPQIEQYLFNKKTKEAADAEITHLRSSAKIEYLNASAPIAP